MVRLFIYKVSLMYSIELNNNTIRHARHSYCQSIFHLKSVVECTGKRKRSLYPPLPRFPVGARGGGGNDHGEKCNLYTSMCSYDLNLI